VCEEQRRKQSESKVGCIENTPPLTPEKVLTKSFRQCEKAKLFYSDTPVELTKSKSPFSTRSTTTTAPRTLTRTATRSPENEKIKSSQDQQRDQPQEQDHPKPGFLRPATRATTNFEKKTQKRGQKKN
jgi:hypothetical protein